MNSFLRDKLNEISWSYTKFGAGTVLFAVAFFIVVAALGLPQGW